jgi:hypothetical protein
MSDYIATPKLRWVVNHQKHRPGAVLDESQGQLVLQQWWETQMYADDGSHRIALPQTVGVWRDVPLETEGA